jgi:fucose permease
MIALGAVGLFDGALGVAWPSMRETFGQPLAALGIVLLAYTGGYFTTSLSGGWLLEHVGTGVALIGAVLLGASGGDADLTLNHELAQNHGVRALGFLHAAWGLGAALGPLLVTAVVAGGRSWRLAFVPVIVVQLGLLVAYVVVRRSWAPVPRHRDEPDDAERLDRVAVALALGMFFLYVGVEAGTGQWGFTLLTEGRAMAERTAGRWMSSYWLGLTAGRLVLGFGGHRRSPDVLLTASVVGSATAVLFLAVDPAGVGYLALPLLGFALAPVFPVLMAVTPERLGVHRAARVIGLQIAASSVGGVVLPSLMGLGAQAWGIETIAVLLSAAASALALVHVAALRQRRPTPR